MTSRPCPVTAAYERLLHAQRVHELAVAFESPSAIVRECEADESQARAEFNALFERQ